MKIRNMLQSIPLLLLIAAGLSVFLNCKAPASNPTPPAPSTPPTSSTPSTSTFYTVTFDAQGGSAVASVSVEGGKTLTPPAAPVKDTFTFGGWYKEGKCTTLWNFATDTVTSNMTLYAQWTAIPLTSFAVTFTVKDGHGSLTAQAGDKPLESGATVKKDTDVTFTVEPESGYEVDYWLINGKKQTGTSVTVKADKNITATVKFKTEGTASTPLVTVNYSAAPPEGGSVTAKEVDGTAVTSGGSVETGTALEFTAEPNTGYEVSAWTGATAAPDKKTAQLTVTGECSVTVTFVLKQYTVTFDAQGGSAVASVSVEHGKTFTQPSDPVRAPFSFGGWYKERECTTPWNFATDTVTSDMTLYAQWTTIIRFNANKMICQKYNDRTPVNPGETVYENEEFKFKAMPSAGQTVNNWTVNGVEKPDETGPWFLYIVRPQDAQGGSITIDYTEKPAAYATISFARNKMTCRRKSNDTPVNPDETVYENDRLVFEAMPSAGQTVNKWTVNGVEKTDGTNPWFSYIVRPQDAQGGSITIDYTEKQAAQVTISFDPNKMKCRKDNGNIPVNPGETVYENERLEFEATLPAGQTVDKWTVNGVEKLDKTKPWFLRYTVRAQDAQGGSITIDYTEKQAAYATISFNPSKMKCRKILDISLTGTPVLSGDTVYEHDRLMFSAQPAAGKMADSWTVNGAPLKNADVIGNNVLYQIDSSSSSSLNFDYTEKTAEKLELQFDASRIQCTKLPDQTPVSPGPRDEGDALLFSPKDGSIVAWKVNGKPYDIIIIEKSCLLEFTKKAAKKYGNENVLTVSY